MRDFSCIFFRSLSMYGNTKQNDIKLVAATLIVGNVGSATIKIMLNAKLSNVQTSHMYATLSRN